MTGMQSTAILFFTRSARMEAAAKPLAGGRRRPVAVRIAQAMIRQSRKVAENTGLPVFEITETSQHGQTFGERFCDAIEQVFQKGFAHVIAIGNDSPELRSPHILEAQRQLQHSDLVIGPAKDGGVYLLGVSRQAFVQAAYTDLPWETKFLTEGLRGLGTEIVWLPALADIDSAADLRTCLARMARESAFVRVMLQVLRTRTEYRRAARLHLRTQVAATHLARRGPPH